MHESEAEEKIYAAIVLMNIQNSENKEYKHLLDILTDKFGTDEYLSLLRNLKLAYYELLYFDHPASNEHKLATINMINNEFIQLRSDPGRSDVGKFYNSNNVILEDLTDYINYMYNFSPSGAIRKKKKKKKTKRKKKKKKK